MDTKAIFTRGCNINEVFLSFLGLDYLHPAAVASLPLINEVEVKRLSFRAARC